MKSFLTEYGLLFISIIGVAFFFFVWAMFVNGKSGFGVVYNTWRPDVSALRGSSSVEKDSVENSSVPYFKVSDDVSKYKITGKTFTKSQALAPIEAYYKGARLNANDITVIVYRYSPVMSTTASSNSGNINEHVMLAKLLDNGGNYTYDALKALHDTGDYSEVFATDKYGNYLYDNNGKYIPNNQPIYKVSKEQELTDSKPINVLNVSEKYRVVYRVTGGTLKAECQRFFTNENVRDNFTPLGEYSKTFGDSPIDNNAMFLSADGGEFDVTTGYSGGGIGGEDIPPESEEDDESEEESSDSDESEEDESSESKSSEQESSESEESSSKDEEESSEEPQSSSSEQEEESEESSSSEDKPEESSSSDEKPEEPQSSEEKPEEPQSSEEEKPEEPESHEEEPEVEPAESSESE